MAQKKVHPQDFPVELAMICMEYLNQGCVTIHRDDQTGKVTEPAIYTSVYPGSLKILEGWYYDNAGRITCLEKPRLWFRTRTPDGKLWGYCED